MSLAEQNDNENNKIKFEILRLITPLLIGVVGTLCFMQYGHIESSLKITGDKVQSISEDVSGVKEKLQSIEGRLIRDETIYDKRGFK